jgi:hypothetical protein
VKLRKFVLRSSVNSLGFIPARNESYEIGARTKADAVLYFQRYERSNLKAPEPSNYEDRMPWNTGLARIGAVFYVLWGLVHYNAAYGVYQLAQSTPLTIEHGRLAQLAFYLASFATAGIVLATRNWRNSPLGFWCSAIVVSIGDIPFVLFVLVPGYVPVWPGILGPALWIAALTCTAIAQVPTAGTVGSAKLGAGYP